MFHRAVLQHEGVPDLWDSRTNLDPFDLVVYDEPQHNTALHSVIEDVMEIVLEDIEAGDPEPEPSATVASILEMERLQPYQTGIAWKKPIFEHLLQCVERGFINHGADNGNCNVFEHPGTGAVSVFTSTDDMYCAVDAFPSWEAFMAEFCAPCCAVVDEEGTSRTPHFVDDVMRKDPRFVWVGIGTF